MKQICVSSCTTNLTTGLNAQAFSFWLVFVISRFVDFSLYANYVLFTSEVKRLIEKKICFNFAKN